MLKAVLFDLDGTLVNSLEDLAVAGNTALKKLGFPIHDIDEYKYFVGDGIPKLIERIIPEYAATQENINKCLKDFLEFYSEHFADKTYAYSGIKSLLESLKQMGIKLAVVSNKAQEMADLVTTNIFGDNTFDLCLGKREGIAAKPSADALFFAAEKLNVDISSCVFVGDSGMDMAAAANAGISAVGVLWGFRTSEELRDNGASFLARTPEELLSRINTLYK